MGRFRTQVIAQVAGIATCWAMLCASPTRAQQPQPSAPSFAECEAAVDDAALRRAATAGAEAAIKGSIERLDYDKIVRDAWRAARFDRSFARIVDQQIAVIRKDTSLVSRLADANWPPYAEEMAKKTTRLVFDSEEFKALEKSLQREIARRIEPELAKAELQGGDRAAQCVREFLGARYAEVVRSAVASELATRGEGDLRVENAGAGGSAAVNLSTVIAGLLVIAFRRVVRRLITSMTQRLIGVIAARAAAWASVVAGVALVTYEVIAGSDGVFPDIRDALVSEETRTEIQQTIVGELKTVGFGTLEGRADAIANQMVARWNAFRSNHRAALSIAEREPAFAAFLKRPEVRGNFDKLSALTATIAEKGGDKAVVEAVRTGVLARAMRISNVDAQLKELAPRGVDLQELVTWADKLGFAYRKAADYELPGLFAFADVGENGVRKLLDLDTPAQAQKVGALPATARADLLALDQSDLQSLARAFDAPSLEAISGAVRVLPERDKKSALQTIVGQPERAAALSDPDVIAAVASSGSPSVAMSVLLDPSSRWDPFAVINHLTLAAGGKVSLQTLAYRYGWGLVILIGIPAIFVIGLLRSIASVFGGRRRG